MANKTIIEPACYNEVQTAEYINMSVAFLRYHRQHGSIKGKAYGPRYIKLGEKCVRYLVGDLDNWLKNRQGYPQSNDTANNIPRLIRQ